MYTVSSPLTVHLYNSHFLADSPNIDSSLNLSAMATSSVPKVVIEGKFNYSNKACGCEKWIQSNLAVD